MKNDGLNGFREAIEDLQKYRKYLRSVNLNTEAQAIEPIVQKFVSALEEHEKWQKTEMDRHAEKAAEQMMKEVHGG